jgi:hypothetical protein
MMTRSRTRAAQSGQLKGMPLTLRPTGLRSPAAFAHLADWAVLHDGVVIGRISEEQAPANPENAWSWSMTQYVDPRAQVITHGRAASLDEAKAAFQAACTAWQLWPRPTAEAAELFRWHGDRIGVAFTLSDGRNLSRLLEPADWPVIDRLKEIGRLTYRDADARALAKQLRRP